MRVLPISWMTPSVLKSPRLFGGILTDFSSVVVWKVSIFTLISSSSSLFTRYSGTVLSAPTTIDITVIFMFHNFFSSLWQGFNICLSFSFLLFSLSGPLEKIKFTWWQVFSSCKSRFQALTGRSMCIWNSQRILCVSFSRTDSGLYICQILEWLNLLHCSQWIAFPT